MLRLLSSLFVIILLSFVEPANAFTPHIHSFQNSILPTSAPTTSTTALSAVPSASKRARRNELLARNGPFFKLNRMQGQVELGSSAKLVTRLDNSENLDAISEFLSDGQGLAMSIWDEKLMKDLGNSIYRLQTMKLQFVTIQLAPRVDMKMWTELEASNKNLPLFSLQSVDFDPNIQLLPGVGVPASSLGIHIEVEGELRPTADGKGVEGKISFATSGILPPPMRLLPEGALKMASDTINETIVKFAIQSFESGARKKYTEFRLAKKQQKG
eukprot:scaffold4204_cov140-Cylindrotheca_fusiformis.AAC.11